MTKITKIETVSKTSLVRFNQRANFLIKHGYQPLGKIQMVSKNWDKVYLQQFVKYEESK